MYFFFYNYCVVGESISLGRFLHNASNIELIDASAVHHLVSSPLTQNHLFHAYRKKSDLHGYHCNLKNIAEPYSSTSTDQPTSEIPRKIYQFPHPGFLTLGTETSQGPRCGEGLKRGCVLSLESLAKAA